MTLVKHIVTRCETNSRLSDRMSEILSALLIKLTDLSQHEEEMKSFKKPLDEVNRDSIVFTCSWLTFIAQQTLIEWPMSSKIAQLLCRVEKTFAKHIGPEEFVQCSSNLVKEKSNYDVPTTSTSVPLSSMANVAQESKKKTCNLENYFEWSSRLRMLVANEILQVKFLPSSRLNVFFTPGCFYFHY